LSQLDGSYGRDDDDIATMWMGMYERDTHRLLYASAGHPPPVFAAIDDQPSLLAHASAPPLGTGAVAAHVRDEEVYWQAGALLVAYSDGLVERPEHDLELQLHQLRDLVGRTQAARMTDVGPHSVAERLLNALVPDAASALDDVCVLVLRRDEESGP
jgi:serine phosphatase RsbU (regulator of sigma subunit)